MMTNKTITPLLGILTLSIVSCMHDEYASIILQNNNNNDNNIVLFSSDTLLARSLTSSDTTTLITLQNGLVLERIDSLYYWDDMVFSEKSLRLLHQDDRSACIDGFQYYWPEGKVYYKFNMSVPPAQRSIFVYAMNSIQRSTSIEFKYRSNNNISNYILFNKSTTVNNSPVGMQTGEQIINIHNVDTTTIMHEIMHSLGFFHEHTRTDRDNYIFIDSLNIKPNKWHNFQKYNISSYFGMDLDSFDFNSIMLYDSWINDPTFVFDTSIPTMTKWDGTTFSQGETLSEYDIKGVNSIYGPPFHRIEHHRLNVIKDGVVGNIEEFISEDSDSLVFYADKNCTIRQALLYPRKIRIKTTVRTNNGYNLQDNESYSTFVVPAGTSTILFWHGNNYECYYSSNPYIINLTKNEVVNIHVPEIWINHTDNSYYNHYW